MKQKYQSTINVGTSSRLILRGLVDRTNTLIVGANVTLQNFTDRAGNAVTGITLPSDFTDEGGGEYQLELPSNLGVTPGVAYLADVQAEYLGLIASWRETILCKHKEA